MRYLVIISFCLLVSSHLSAQTYVFAQLNGAPVNTAGWNLTGAAAVGNVTGTSNSEILLCTNQNYQSGAIFYNQPINLNICNQWIAEFDFRIFDGNAADGIAFCFLDVPPSGFVNGGGLGIPGSANGLKVCFDTYLNCAATGTTLPKMELRWGIGYDECWSQPTIQNTSGLLSVIRSPNYCHAKIVYNNGNIEVYLNNVLVITGFQVFNFTGYLGFTAATGGFNDNHSIKNVVIYTNMPPSEAGMDQTICSGQTIQIGTTPNLLYTYAWSPAAGLSNPLSANPSFTFTNTSSVPVVQKLYVNTAFLANSGCASVDSISITILPSPALSITTPSTTICSGTNAIFTASAANAGAAPVYQWSLNGQPAGTNSSTFSTTALNQGDVVACALVSTATCGGAQSNSITMTVTPALIPTIQIAGNTTVCEGAPSVFTATVSNGGSAPQYQWKKNGLPVGVNSSSYTDNSLQSGDQLSCELVSNGNCVSTLPVNSNILTITVNQKPVVSLDQTSFLCKGATRTLNAGNFTSYVWQDGSTASTFTVSTTGTYTVTVTDALGCQGIGSVTISTLLPAPSAFLPKDSSFCEFNSFVLSPLTSFSTYLWNNNDNSPQITVNQPGLYWLEVASAQGCTGRDSVLYTIRSCTDDIYFPDAFTPDGNGRNDVFRPLASNTLEQYSFAVYNRWGQRIFFTRDQQKGWDGKISGARQSSGVFIWTCTYRFPGQASKTAKGTVMLIR